MEIVTKAPRLADGIWKWLPMCRSSVVPCFMNSVFTCAIIVLGMMVTSRMGSMMIICLVSSTCVTVHTLHVLVMILALLRNFKVEVDSILLDALLLLEERSSW